MDDDMSATEETSWIALFIWTTLVVIALFLSGCAGNLGAAITTANIAGQVEQAGGEVLRIRCTEAYKRATAVQVPELDRDCLPPAKALAGLRTARLGLLAGIAAAQAANASGVNPAVVASVIQATAAAAQMAKTLEE